MLLEIIIKLNRKIVLKLYRVLYKILLINIIKLNYFNNLIKLF